MLRLDKFSCALERTHCCVRLVFGNRKSSVGRSNIYRASYLPGQKDMQNSNCELRITIHKRRGTEGVLRIVKREEDGGAVLLIHVGPCPLIQNRVGT